MNKEEKHLADVSKKVHEIRKIMGYATKDQREEGYISELRSVSSLCFDCWSNSDTQSNWLECGGFRYTLLKNGNIRITPAFGWIIKNSHSSVSHRTDKRKMIKNGDRKRHKK